MKKTAFTDLVSHDAVKDLHAFMRQLIEGEKTYLLRNDILVALEEYELRTGSCHGVKENSLNAFLRKVHEIIVMDGFVVVIHRYQVAKDRLYKIAYNGSALTAIEEISIEELLNLRDQYVLKSNGENETRLKINFMPFYDYSPLIRDPKNVGRGIEFLSRHLSSAIFHRPEKWNSKLFEFLKIHSLGGKQLLINGASIKDLDTLVERLDQAVEVLQERGSALTPGAMRQELRQLGFEAGWGNKAERILETMSLLLDLFEAPDNRTLEAFIERIPMVAHVAVISPHGFFGQENVLGKPDTGGQVVYILDQVKALERYLMESLRFAGVELEPKIVVVTRLIPESENTTSHIPLEQIQNTENAWILRVPFRDKNNEVVNYWISRFWVWPYLEKFVYETKEALQVELGRQPDLIIGNYSDGNLVASLLSEETGVIQCNIAHALEKSKYLFSDLYWKNMESDYHFSLQFTADLLSMNMADFIVTSTFQEIAGTAYDRGQYESYKYYTMPGFCQVSGGINLFHPKFNVISPGVDESVYFPYSEKHRRDSQATERLTRLLLSETGDEIFGRLEKPQNVPIFTMARLDKIKNLSGLVECFGASGEKGADFNLIVVGGKVDPEQTDDPEERAEILRMHQLIKTYKLSGRIRWFGMQLPKADTGEIYRIIADYKGVFVQPALFEAFGLTVLEAMSCGLPVFATQFGGPSEIIQPGVNGFLINPTRHDQLQEQIFSFLRGAGDGSLTWKHISENAIKRVAERFTWRHYSEKLLRLTKLYGFWRYAVTNEEKKKMKIYSQTLYHLLYKQRAGELLP
ncbi:MAG: sucrose synthase [bacterium]|nr:sucrose synthase [bacterium]